MATSCRMVVSQDCQRSTQSTRDGETLSKMMASGLVASCFVLVLVFTNTVLLPVTDYTSASGI